MYSIGSEECVCVQYRELGMCVCVCVYSIGREGCVYSIGSEGCVCNVEGVRGVCVCVQ